MWEDIKRRIKDIDLYGTEIEKITAIEHNDNNKQYIIAFDITLSGEIKYYYNSNFRLFAIKNYARKYNYYDNDYTYIALQKQTESIIESLNLESKLS